MDELIHLIFDFGYLFLWILSSLWDIIQIIIMPLRWIVSFLKGFWISATAPPVEPAIIYTISDQVKEVFNAIPYFQHFTMAIGIGLAIIVLAFIFKRLANF